MKKNIWKRIASLALALVLVVGLVPITARAAFFYSEYGYKVTIDDAKLYSKATGQTYDLEGAQIIIYEPELKGNTVSLDFKPVFYEPNSYKTSTYGVLVNETLSLDCTTPFSLSGTYQSDPYAAKQFTVKYTITRAAGSHSGGNPTCTTPGNCEICGKPYTVAENHKYEWKHDETKHWQECTENSAHKGAEGSHNGGTATCSAKAICSTCSASYGEINANNHVWGLWIIDDTNHSRVCTLNNTHTQNGEHSGGSATCIHRPKCSTCSSEYGTVDSTEHLGYFWKSNGNGTHTRTCYYTNTHTETGNCSGGTATCAAQAVCTTCKTGYGSMLSHNYTYTVSGTNIITESCDKGCGHNLTATLQLKSGADLHYTGKAVEPYEIVYPEGWVGEKKQPADTDYKDNVNAGTDTASCSFTYTAGATVSKTFSIEAVRLDDCTVTMSAESGIYTGQTHSRPSYTLTYNGEVLTKDTDYNEVGEWIGDFINAGNHLLNLEGKGNFTGAKTLTYTIGKGTPTRDLFGVQWPENPTYDGITTFPVDVTTTASGMGEFTVKYNGSTDAPINAGTYTVTVDVAEGDNYNAVTTLTVGEFTIAPTAGSIIIPANQSVTYDGAPVEYNDLNPTITADGALTVKWYDSEGTEIAAPTNAGTYQIGISAAAGNNYEAVDEVKQTFTIAKANPIYTAPTANNGLVYNGRKQTLITYVPSIGGTVYYSLDGTNYDTSFPEGINAQEYTVYYKIVGDENHNDVEPQTVTATIAPVNIETTSRKAGVQGGPFTYNGQERTPVPQLDVFVNDYPVPGTPNAPGADVRLTEGIDYSVTYSDNVNAGQAVVTFTGKGNYTGTITTKFTIAPKPITVTIADKTSVYGEEIVELTADDNGGIVNGDTNVYSLATTATKTSDVGTYDITGTALDSNYAITFVDGTYTITKANAAFTAPTANTLTYDSSEKTLIAAGSTGDGTMVYSLEKEGTYTTELPTATTAGIYRVWYKVIGDKNHEDSAADYIEVEIAKADPGIGSVTAGVINDTLETSAIVLTRENTDIDGNLTVDAEQTLSAGENTIRYTFTPNDTTNYKVVKGEVTVTVVDTIAPTGTVTISTKSWAEFLNTITFGLFFKETQSVSVAASDNLSGVAKIEYIESKAAMDLDAVKAATQWTEMENGSVSVTLEDTKQFIYYIRITDKSGNVAYLSTDGSEYDTTAPVIKGVDNGKTYYTTQKVTITDKNINAITLNGEAATGSITLEGNKEATYTIVATDRAGNSTTITVKMAPIADIVRSMEGKTDTNVISDDKTNLQTIVDTATELLQDENITAEEKAELEKAKADAEALIQVIEDTAAELKAVTDKAAQFDEDKVKSTDKAELEKLVEDIEALLDTNNLTQDEQTALETILEQVEGMTDTINETAADIKAATDAIDALDPDTVKSTDKKTVEEALETIENLLNGDYLTADERKALDDAKADAEALIDAIKAAQDSNVMLFGSVFTMSLAALIALFFAIKKKRKQAS